MIKKGILLLFCLVLFSKKGLFSIGETRALFVPQTLENDILVYRFLEVPFVDDTRNVIVDRSGALSSAVDSLRRLRSLYDRGVRFARQMPITFSVVHIGDSHIQADLMTDVTRSLMQSTCGSAGRGFIAPLRLAGTNEPSDYRITSNVKAWNSAKVVQRDPKFDVGLGGIAIEPKQKRGVAELNIELLRGDAFNSITVFHNSDAPSFVEEERYCTDMGSSYEITDYATDIDLTESTSSLVLQANLNDKQYSTPIYYGFNLKNGRNGVFYHAIGVNGATFYSYNKNQGFFSQLSALHPEIVILSMGTNEASQANFFPDQFRAEMDGFVRRLKQESPKATIILTTPVGNYRKFRGRVEVNSHITKVADEIVAYATENEIPYWDLYRITGGENSARNMDDYALFRTDRLHFTETGYRLQGELLYRALIKLLE